MSRPRSFAGAITPLIWRALSPASFFTGSVAVGLMAALFLLSRSVGMPAAAASLWMAVGSVIVVRIAVNTARGDERGGLLEASGGSWAEVLRIAARVIVLNLVWSVPCGLAFAGLAKGLGAIPHGGPAYLLLIGMGLIPPVAVIVAMGSYSLGQALSPASWLAVVARRGDDVATLIVVCAGAFLTSLAAAAVVALGLGSFHPKFELFLMMVGGTWAIGVGLVLTGRLTGTFVRGAEAEVLSDEQIDAYPEYSLEFEPTAFGSSEHSGPLVTVPFVKPLAAASRATPGVEPAPPADGADSVLGRLRANLRIEEDDRDLALEDAEHLIGQFGPHPQVLARVAVLQHRLQLGEALETARRTVEAARVVNNAGVLADLYEEFREELESLEISDVERQRMAASLAARGHYSSAIDLYDAILTATPRSLPVVKAMIKLAGEGGRTEEGAERALRIYDVIESHWTDHPFVEFVDRGRDDARRKLERVMQ